MINKPLLFINAPVADGDAIELRCSSNESTGQDAMGSCGGGSGTDFEGGAWHVDQVVWGQQFMPLMKKVLGRKVHISHQQSIVSYTY